MPALYWNIGPDEIGCLVAIEIHPGDREVWYDSNLEGNPGTMDAAEILYGETRIIEGGKRRRLTDEEFGWLEEEEAEIEEAVLAADD